MADNDQGGLRGELADIEETLRRLASESGDPEAGAARDQGDAALDLTERMEVEAQVEALTRRREAIQEQLAGEG
jgi:hypothetical protein